jgi:cytoskeletal protein CcmA (bactofilin family)
LTNSKTLAEKNDEVDIRSGAIYNLRILSGEGGKMTRFYPADKDTDSRQEGAIPRNIARLGPLLSLKGELSGEEDIMIEGHIQGKVNLQNNNLLVGKRGNIEADIHVKSITIEGSVTGNIYASGKVFISKEGRMKGDITASVISIMDGAQFKGTVKMGEVLQTTSSPEKEPELFSKKEETETE